MYSNIQITKEQILDSLLFELLHQKLIEFINFQCTIYFMPTRIYIWNLHYLTIKLQLMINIKKKKGDK